MTITLLFTIHDTIGFVFATFIAEVMQRYNK